MPVATQRPYLQIGASGCHSLGRKFRVTLSPPRPREQPTNPHNRNATTETKKDRSNAAPEQIPPRLGEWIRFCSNIVEGAIVQTNQNQRGEKQSYQQRAAKKREPGMFPRIKPRAARGERMICSEWVHMDRQRRSPTSAAATG